MDQPVREEVDYRVRLSKNRVAAVVSCHLTSKLLTFHGGRFLASSRYLNVHSAAVQESATRSAPSTREIGGLPRVPVASSGSMGRQGESQSKSLLKTCPGHEDNIYESQGVFR